MSDKVDKKHILRYIFFSDSAVFMMAIFEKMFVQRPFGFGL